MRKLFFAIMVLSILFSSFVFSQECGDFVCDAGEDASCPSDCTPNDTGEQNIMMSQNLDNENNILGEAGQSSFFSSNIFKTIIILLILIVLGVVGFFIYRKTKNDRVAAENQPQIQPEGVIQNSPVSG